MDNAIGVDHRYDDEFKLLKKMISDSGRAFEHLHDAFGNIRAYSLAGMLPRQYQDDIAAPIVFFIEPQ